MSDQDKKADVNKILGGIGESVSGLAKGFLDLAKVGADKAQSAINDYQSGKAKDAKKPADKKAKKEKDKKES